MVNFNCLSRASRRENLSPQMLFISPFKEGARNFLRAFSSEKAHKTSHVTLKNLSNLSSSQRVHCFVIGILLVFPLINIITMLVLRHLEIHKRCSSPRPSSDLPISRFGLDGISIEGSSFQAVVNDCPISAIYSDKHLKMLISGEESKVRLCNSQAGLSKPKAGLSTILLMLWGDANHSLTPLRKSDDSIVISPHLTPLQQEQQKKRQQEVLRIQDTYGNLPKDIFFDTTITSLDDLIKKGKELNLSFSKKQLPLNRGMFLQDLLTSKKPVVVFLKEKNDLISRPAIIDKYIKNDSQARTHYNTREDTFMVRYTDSGATVCYVKRDVVLASLQGREVLEFNGISLKDPQITTNCVKVKNLNKVEKKPFIQKEYADLIPLNDRLLNA